MICNQKISYIILITVIFCSLFAMKQFQRIEDNWVELAEFRRVQCTHCQKTTNKGSIKCHLFNLHGIFPYRCTEQRCKKGFEFEKELKKHMKKEHNQTYKRSWISASNVPNKRKRKRKKTTKNQSVQTESTFPELVVDEVFMLGLIQAAGLHYSEENFLPNVFNYVHRKKAEEEFPLELLACWLRSVEQSTPQR